MPVRLRFLTPSDRPIRRVMNALHIPCYSAYRYTQHNDVEYEMNGLVTMKHHELTLRHDVPVYLNGK
ncbi:MAG: hypothetical protein LBD79_03390 [Treponema sp.]|nr:hypothetical protein [Treponema sp.]